MPGKSPGGLKETVLILFGEGSTQPGRFLNGVYGGGCTAQKKALSKKNRIGWGGERTTKN
jgi:hypothetical protein